MRTYLRMCLEIALSCWVSYGLLYLPIMNIQIRWGFNYALLYAVVMLFIALPIVEILLRSKTHS